MPVTSQSQLNWNDIREDVKRSMEAAFKRNFFPGLFIFVLALFIVFLYYFDEGARPFYEVCSFRRFLIFSQLAAQLEFSSCLFVLFCPFCCCDLQ